MGTTKIWAIKDSLSRVLDYAANPHKTIYSDLRNVLHYAGDEEKTGGAEKACFVTGVNCSAVTAFDEMRSVQERFGKTTGNVAYHAYQSFKTDEVTPELCHQIGVELARKMWGGGYQVLVATHFNTGTYHNHFVINAVSYQDGKKFNCNKKAYYHFREVSDQVCRYHGLSVIENPLFGTPRSIYMAEKEGKPTKNNEMRKAIDQAIRLSYQPGDFDSNLYALGYEVRYDWHERSYWIHALDGENELRMDVLGSNYTEDRILERITSQSINEVQNENLRYLNWRKKEEQEIKHIPFHKLQPEDGLILITLTPVLYLMGIDLFPEEHKNEYVPLSPRMKEASRFLDRYSEQVRFTTAYQVKDLEEIPKTVQVIQKAMDITIEKRTKVVNRLRRCKDPIKVEALKKERKELSSTLAYLRRDLKTAQGILQDFDKTLSLVEAEKQAQERFMDIQNQLNPEWDVPARKASGRER